MRIQLPIIAITAVLAAGTAGSSMAAKASKLTPEWKEKIRRTAPAEPMAKPKKKRKVLVFSLITGFNHWVTPHTEAVISILGEKSGAFEAVASNDIEEFRPKNLAKYDAVVLNNNCPDRKDRDIFRDVLIHKVDKFGAKYKDLPLGQREKMADSLFASLMKYVAGGGGLIVIHGAIANFNNSDEFSDALGASFAYHPPQQEVVLKPVDPDHPLLKSFGGEPFVHVDEPYIFNRAYPKMNFHPLLEIDTGNMKKLKQYGEISKMPRYCAWIKRHGEGRAFYCSPAHNAGSFERPELLQFILGGIQYALGDLDCPDAPMTPAAASRGMPWNKPQPGEGSAQFGGMLERR